MEDFFAGQFTKLEGYEIDSKKASAEVGPDSWDCTGSGLLGRDRGMRIVVLN